MATEFGKVLRIIRINAGDSAKDMAEKLEISPSYLSAIENGKRNIPSNLIGVITEKYELANKDVKKLKEALARSTDTLKIDCSDLEDKKKQVLFALTKNDLDEATLNRLCEIIKNK